MMAVVVFLLFVITGMIFFSVINGTVSSILLSIAVAITIAITEAIAVAVTVTAIAITVFAVTA